jgi:hypothetical protein
MSGGIAGMTSQLGMTFLPCLSSSRLMSHLAIYPIETLKVSKMAISSGQSLNSELDANDELHWRE